MARPRSSGSPDLKIPLPTNTVSAPSIIIKAASAGVATPPALKLGTGNLPCSANPANQIIRRAQIFGEGHQFFFGRDGQTADFAVNAAQMAHSFHHVSRSGFAFGADERGAFSDAAQRLAQIFAAAHEWHLEIVFENMEFFVGGCENFRFVNEIHAERFENARFGDVADATFCHHGNGDSRLNFADHLRVAHARDAAMFANITWHPFERHYRAGSGAFGDLRLFDVGDIHNDAAFEHFGKSDFGRENGALRVG